MINFLHNIEIKTLKRDLTWRFIFLLSFFLILLAGSYVVSSIAISAKEYDSILLNTAGRQRMLIRQYAGEVNQVLAELAASNLEMTSLEKKKLDQTEKLFEKTHEAFVHGGEVTTHLEAIVIPPLKIEGIHSHLDRVDKEWQELKRIASLSLKSAAHSAPEITYTSKLFDQATKAVMHMDNVVQLMQRNSEIKLRRLGTILLTMVIIGSILFLVIIYFVYQKIVLPLDYSITTLRHTTEKLEIEKTRAEKAYAVKSEFLSRMSHELRTPLNAILGFGQLLEMDAEGFNETQQGNVKEILGAGHHLLNLINEVLDLARIESGMLEVSMDEVPVDDVLQQCISLIKSQAEARQVELIDHVSGKGYTVQADFTRLKQVLLNLLTNAVKYNIEKGRITLDSEIIDKQRLRIRVTDTGEGLSKDLVDKLFTPFDRLNVTDNIEGTGIGLVISRHLTGLMGGTMGVESSPGKGSTFWVELARTSHQAAAYEDNDEK